MKKHINYYILETTVLGVGFFAIYALSLSVQYQAFLIGGLVLLYSLMGIMHHKVQHDIHAKIVLEYILISVLVFSVFLFLKSGIV